MIFNYITGHKNRNIFKIISGIMLFSFIITINGCYTADNQSISKDSVKYDVSLKIISVQMKNGLIMNLKDKMPRYMSEYEGQKNVIIYADTKITKVSENVYNTGSAEIKIIKLDDVYQVIVEKDEFNTAGTILTILGILAGLFIILAAIAAATKESCPFVYSYDGFKYTFDAEPYGGAITAGLTRTDYSRLEYLKPSGGEYKLLMRNEADETQHTDEMKLWVIDHSPDCEVAPDATGKLAVYTKLNPPVSASDENGVDITSLIKTKDNIKWQTGFPPDTTVSGLNLRHELIFKFVKPGNTAKVKLLVNAGTALWGGYMIKGMLNLRGDKVDDWYKSINEKGSEFTDLYKFMEREELYSLKVNLLENKEWVKKSYITAGGPFIYEDRIIELNTENITDDTLTVKLSPPYGFWEIDQIGIIYESNQTPDVREIPVKSAIDQSGNSITGMLRNADTYYYDMPDSGSRADVYFDVPQQEKGTARTLYLKTTGYYDIHLKKNKPEQREFIEQIYNTPGLIVEYAMKEYVRKINELQITKSADVFNK